MVCLRILIFCVLNSVEFGLISGGFSYARPKDFCDLGMIFYRFWIVFGWNSNGLPKEFVDFAKLFCWFWLEFQMEF